MFLLWFILIVRVRPLSVNKSLTFVQYFGQPCGHLLGKSCPLGFLRVLFLFYVLNRLYSFPVWCLGQDVWTDQIASKAELGRFPLAVSSLLQSVKYWLYVLQNPFEKATRFSSFNITKFVMMVTHMDHLTVIQDVCWSTLDLNMCGIIKEQCPLIN